MSKSATLPVALTIAGSDSGGGAGVQADLKTFAALGVHGASAITCVTAQNPVSVAAIEPCSPGMVRRQIEMVFAGLDPAAAKTGMFYSAAIIRVVAGCFKRRKKVIPLIVDPVMISTRGRRLLAQEAIGVLKRELLPLAALVTPNVAEGESLLGRKLRTVEDLRTAARELQKQFGCAALMKGGHLKGLNEAADVYFDGKNELLLTAPFIKGVRTHGTGCTFSAAITAFLARGFDLPEAVAHAKEHITQAIAHSQEAAKHEVLNNFWHRP